MLFVTIHLISEILNSYLLGTLTQEKPADSCHGNLFQVNDSSMTLLGETQEEDRKLIADLCLAKMEVYCRPVSTNIRSVTAGLSALTSGQLLPTCKY